MSMIGKLRRVAPSAAVRAKNDAGFAMSLTGLDDPFASLPWHMRILFRLVGVANPAGPRIERTEGGESLALQKSWHALHWLICQHPWEGEPPLRYSIMGQTPVGEDTGYGEPGLNSPEQVQRIAEALAELSSSSVLSRYDAAKMTELEIYPGGWQTDRSWSRELERSFRQLNQFYKRAAESGDAVLTWIE